MDPRRAQPDQRAATPPTEHTEVYAVPADKSPDGVFGLASPVAEWTSTSPTHSTAVTRGGSSQRAELIRETRSGTVSFPLRR